MMRCSIPLMMPFALAGAVSAASLDLATATIPELQRAYDAGLSAETVVQVYLDRIAAYDQAGPRLNAILELNPHALDDARKLDAERRTTGPRSPLHGVPLLIKDNIDTADLPTTGGAQALRGLRPPRDAFVVARLRQAGAIILAKTNLDEFERGATGTSSLGGQTLNPYNPEKIPGGSSSGSAVGVAALFGWAALGTETGSSIRNPATKNNLVGFCPSEGLVSRRGVIPSSLVFDRVGTMARNVSDAVLVMQAIATVDPGDLLTLEGLGHTPPAVDFRAALDDTDLARARIGVLRQLFGTAAEDQPAVALVEQAVAGLRRDGATVIDPVRAGVDLWRRIREVSGGDGEDSRAALEYYFSTRGPGFPFATVRDLLDSGKFLGRLRGRYEHDLTEPEPGASAAVRTNLKQRAALRALVLGLMERHHVDVLIYPHETKPARTLAVEVPDGGNSPGPSDKRGVGKGNTISSATGLPTIVVPVGFNTDGVGVGMEFLGRLYDETTVIRIAHAFAVAHPHRQLPAATPPLGQETISY